MKLTRLTESITVYRGTTAKNLPRRYPGTFYTTDERLAHRYAKSGGTVKETQLSPKKIFNVDDVVGRAPRKAVDSLWNAFVSYMEKHHPDVGLEDTQLYDNIKHGVTDFSYPTIYDNGFLKSLGYDAVFFSTEGGEKVNSFYVPD